MKKLGNNMCEGPLFSSIVLYTIPIILTSLLQLLFNAADLVVVGRFCGSVSVAAVGATGSITNLIVNMFIGLSVGSGVTVAQAIGGQDNATVHKTVHTAIPTAILSGLVLTVIGVCFSKTFLQLMGTPENVLPLSSLYMKIYFGGITFTMVYNFGASILRAAGDTKSPLIFLSAAGVINVILNVIFVTLFNMNVAGVALATVISQAVSAILVIIALIRRNDACKLSFSKFRFHKRQLARILQIGLPAGIQGSLFSISNVTIQSSINSFGDIVMSGNAAAANIEGFVYVIMNAFHQTALNFTGQNIGAGLYSRVKKIFFICLACVGVSGFAFSSLVYIFGKQLLSIYITDSPEAITYGMIRFSIVCATYCICGMMDTVTGSIRGMGSSLPPMLITILCVCAFRIAWVFTIFRIPDFHTIKSLYISYPISWSVALVVEITAFMLIYRKRCKRTE